MLQVRHNICYITNSDRQFSLEQFCLFSYKTFEDRILAKYVMEYMKALQVWQPFWIVLATILDSLTDLVARQQVT